MPGIEYNFKDGTKKSPERDGREQCLVMAQFDVFGCPHHFGALGAAFWMTPNLNSPEFHTVTLNSSFPHKKNLLLFTRQLLLSFCKV